MARKLTALQGLLDEPATTPKPTPQTSGTARSVDAAAVPAPNAPKPAQAPPGAEEQTVRSTLDLPASRHTALLREAVDAGVNVGWPVRPQHVLRAMFEEFIDDPDAVARVRDRIRSQGRPTRRRNT